MNTQIYVKKLVSMNPEKFKFFTLDYMLDKYAFYLLQIPPKKHLAKNFRQWLRTEI